MITFVDYQYKGIGGVAQLVVNITCELNKRGQQTKVYCSRNSYEYKRLLDNNGQFVFIDSEAVTLNQIIDFLAPDDVIVLTNINNTPLLERIKILNNRIIFYSVHPQVFFVYNKKMNWMCRQEEAVLELADVLYSNNALYIMDGPNLKALTEKGWHHGEISWLPVPFVNSLNKRKYNNDISNRPLRLTYIGRGDWDNKIYPAIKVLEDLNQISTICELHVITNEIDSFERLFSKYVSANKIKIVYKLNLYGEELDNYLLKNSDIHIAMGTSALEGAKLGIPTILIDLSEKEFPPYYKYRWLYECEEYCLGGEIIDDVLPYCTGTSLKDKIIEISTIEGWNQIGEKCSIYANDNHSIKIFVDTLLNAAQSTTMTAQMYCNTRFSKNMKYILPVLEKLSKIKKHIGF